MSRAALLALWLLAGSALAGEIRVIELHHSSVDELLPVLRPLAGEDATVTGMNGQLVVRADAGLLDELERIVRVLDRPPRRLLVRVRHQSSDTGSDRGAALGGNVWLDNGDGRGGVTARSFSTDSHGRRDQSFQVQALEGRPAWVETGALVPYVNRQLFPGAQGAIISDTVQFQDVASGFFVVPRINGEQVTVAIYPKAARLDPRQPGAIAYSSAETVVSGPLGQWLELAGTRSSGGERQDGIGASTRRDFSRFEQFQVQVTPLD